MFLLWIIHTQCNSKASRVLYRSSFRVTFSRKTVKLMEKKYIDFFSSLQKTYKDTPHYPICKDIQKRYYLEIYSYSFCYLNVSNFGHSISFATLGLTYIEKANISYINSISKYVERSLVGLSNIDNVLLITILL